MSGDLNERGDPEGTRTLDLQRDRLAFYATELRSHMVTCMGIEPMLPP